MMRNPEYDRFGPWIIEISELDPPPPLFLPYLTREETALLNIKIPRKIERRVANPGMNLYDYMVTLYEEDLVILQRVGDDVRSHTFFYRDVQYLRESENLLKGSVRLATTDTVFDLPFNTVSASIIGRLVDLIRERYLGEVDDAPAVEEPDIQEGDLSYYFNELLAGQKAEYPQLQVLASQSEKIIGSYETSAFRRLLYGITSKSLLESLHLSDGRELKILSHGRDYKYGWQTIYGRDICTIPINNISDVTWEADPNNTAVIHLTLRTSGGAVSYAIMRNNESLDSYARYLSMVIGLAEGETAVAETAAA